MNSCLTTYVLSFVWSPRYFKAKHNLPEQKLFKVPLESLCLIRKVVLQNANFRTLFE